MGIIYLIGANKLLEVSYAEPAVPVICDVTAVHDLSEEVAQVFPGNLVGCLQVVEQDVHADRQVTCA